MRFRFDSLQKRLQIDAFSMETLSVLVCTESLNATKCMRGHLVHACGFLFNFSKVTENANNDKTIDFFHNFSDVAIGSENSPSLN